MRLILLLLVALPISTRATFWLRRSQEEVMGCEDTICPEGWMGFEGHCYMFSENALNFADAKAYCNEQGAYLVNIGTESENAWIYHQIKALMDSNTNNYHTGGNNMVEGQWHWENDFSLIIFNAWSGGTAPTDANNNLFIETDIELIWSAGSISATQNYICEEEAFALWGYTKRSSVDPI